MNQTTPAATMNGIRGAATTSTNVTRIAAINGVACQEIIATSWWSWRGLPWSTTFVQARQTTATRLISGTARPAIPQDKTTGGEIFLLTAAAPRRTMLGRRSSPMPFIHRTHGADKIRASGG